MGNYISRRTGGIEELDLSSNNAFHYPPRSGCYFGSHFIMGGERFETVQPEMYLFGENNDLNFLGNRPSQFPYPIPQTGEPTLTLKSLINIRKDSIRLVRAPSCDASKAKSTTSDVDDDSQCVDSSGTKGTNRQRHSSTNAPPVGNSATGDSRIKKDQILTTKTAYNIEFTFDADCDCTVRIYYFASEDIVDGRAIYTTSESDIISDPYRYKKGSDQVFCQPSHVLEPAKHADDEWIYKSDKDMLPIVIHCVADNPAHANHSHSTFCVLERVSSQAYMLKPLKQKQCIDGLSYLLQEIYGIENKYAQYAKEDDFDESGCECVICMCDVRDTLILPCRHLCLCHSCADNLRYQASNCPICRSPFRALLQIRALQRKLETDAIVHGDHDSDHIETSIVNPGSGGGGGDNISHHSNGVLASYSDGLPAGYEAISLIEALNGHQVVREPETPNQRGHTSIDDDDDEDVEEQLQKNSMMIVKVRAMSSEQTLHSNYTEEEQKFSSTLSTVDNSNMVITSHKSSTLSDSGSDTASDIDGNVSESEPIDDEIPKITGLRGSVKTGTNYDGVNASNDHTETDSSTVSSTSSGQALLTSHLVRGDTLDDYLDVPVTS